MKFLRGGSLSSVLGARKKLTPPDELLKKVLRQGEGLADSGSMLVGDKGILFSPNDYGQNYRLIGEGVEDAAKKVPERPPHSVGGCSGREQHRIDGLKVKPEAEKLQMHVSSSITAPSF